MTRIDTIERALEHLEAEQPTHALSSAEHRLIKQARRILAGELDVPRTYGDKRTRADQQRDARRQQDHRAALGVE